MVDFHDVISLVTWFTGGFMHQWGVSRVITLWCVWCKQMCLWWMVTWCETGQACSVDNMLRQWHTTRFCHRSLPLITSSQGIALGGHLNFHFFHRIKNKFSCWIRSGLLPLVPGLELMNLTTKPLTKTLCSTDLRISKALITMIHGSDFNNNISMQKLHYCTFYSIDGARLCELIDLFCDTWDSQPITHLYEKFSGILRTVAVTPLTLHRFCFWNDVETISVNVGWTKNILMCFLLVLDQLKILQKSAVI